MTELAVHGVHKAYGKVRALAGVDITVASGSLVTVLGPSGCGKTTLLRCVAGFERLDGGTIRLGDRVVAADRVHVPPHRRGVAVVPQEGALFPHLSVAGNVGYGLDRAQRRGSRIDEVLELVGLAGYGQRMPHQLSGGQQQRVAVARALAPRPRLVLLDEPFSALDAGLRAELRADIRTALTADKATALLVTHDQDEALSVADEVVVLREGAVVQQASPADLYRAPADTWVARFVGDAVLLPASAEGGTAQTALGRLELAEPATGSVTVLIRPEQVRVLAAATTPGTISATVRRHHFHGHDAMLDLLLEDGTPISARVLNSSLPCDPGTRVGLSVEGPARAFAATPPS